MHTITLYYKDSDKVETFKGDFKVFATNVIEIYVKEQVNSGFVAGLEKTKTIGVSLFALDRYEIVEGND